jgi:hypothetical protein
MRAPLLLVLVGGVAVAEPNDNLTAFTAQWPKVTVDPKLLHGSPCAVFDATDTAPPISNAAPSSLSPDGKTLVVVANLELDATTGKQLGLGEPGLGLVMLVFDGPTGAVWGRSLTAFRLCGSNGFGFHWSTDSRRVSFDTDTGHGLRVALAEVVERKLRFQGFTNGTPLVSPGVQHVAWLPWFSGYPFAGQDVVDGDQLHIDDLDVWGSSAKGAAEIWDVAWTSDDALTFCGQTPKLRAARYAATLAGKRVTVKRVASDCPQR